MWGRGFVFVFVFCNSKGLEVRATLAYRWEGVFVRVWREPGGGW